MFVIPDMKGNTEKALPPWKNHSPVPFKKNPLIINTPLPVTGVSSPPLSTSLIDLLSQEWNVNSGVAGIHPKPLDINPERSHGVPSGRLRRSVWCAANRSIRTLYSKWTPVCFVCVWGGVIAFPQASYLHPGRQRTAPRSQTGPTEWAE